MFSRIHTIFLLLLFGLASFNMIAQTKVKVEVLDEQNQVKYAGVFDFIITSKKTIAKNGDRYTIVFEKQDKAKFISLFINNLIWSKGSGDLIIKKKWIVDNANIFQPLNVCTPIQVGGNSSMEFNVLKNGTTTLQIPYSIVPKNTSCNKAEQTAFNKGTFNIKFNIKGISAKTNNANISREEKIWNDCGENQFPIECLKRYLKEFPKGRYAKKAIEQLNYSASQHHYREIIKLNRPGQELMVQKACEDFLSLFPPFVDRYSDVQDLLLEAQNGTLFEKNIIVKSNSAENTKEQESLSTTDKKTSTSGNSLDATSGSPKKTKLDEPQLSPEDNAWEAAIADNENPCSAFKAYLTNKNFLKYREIAVREIASRCNIEVGKSSQKGNSYTFIIENVISLDIDSIVPAIDSTAWILKEGTNVCTRELTINFPDEKNYIVYFSDRQIKRHVRTGRIPIGNLLDPVVLFSGDSILFTFEKGTAPFIIYFQQKGGILSFDTLTNKKVLLLSQSFLKDEKKFSGKYSILVSDKVLNVPYTEEDWAIYIAPEIGLMKYLIPIICISLLVLFFVLKHFQNKKRKRKKNELENVMRSNKQSMIVSHRKKSRDTNWKSREQINIQSKTNYTTNEKARAGGGKTKKPSAIKIIGLRRSSKKVFRYSDDAVLLPIIKESVFNFEPHLLWPDSVIENIYFTKKSILTLDHFLVTQNLKLIKEREESIPEIGGILVGQPLLSTKDGKYRIVVQEFVPINAEFHNMFQLEFSTESLAKDLGDIQDQFPEYIAVGWFHTHPGHGLFLSKPDLTIQERFFGEPYQFAMEIDSFSEKLDTAIFTRTRDGVINNTDNKLEPSNWFSWMENVASLDQK